MYIHLLIFVSPRFCPECAFIAELQVVLLACATFTARDQFYRTFSSSIKKSKNLKTFMK